MITKTEFCTDPLNAAVVRQMGGWSDFKESAGDIARHGIDGGFHGFIYHTDTVKFARKNMAAIKAALADDAEGMGESMLAMVASFRCLNGDYTQDDIAQVIYGQGGDVEILNALAWYSGETVARRYDDATS